MSDTQNADTSNPAGQASGAGDSSSSPSLQSPSAQQQSPKQPEIDIEAIKAQAVKEAREALKGDSENLRKDIAKDLAKRLTGEEDKQEVNELVKQFFVNPEAFVAAQQEVILERAREQQREESSQQAADNAVLTEMRKEFPEVVDGELDMIDMFFSRVKAEGKIKDRAEIIREATRRAAKKLKVKPVSERSREDDFTSTTFPAAAALTSHGNVSKEGVSTAVDFLKGRKAHAAAVRGGKGKS